MSKKYDEIKLTNNIEQAFYISSEEYKEKARRRRKNDIRKKNRIEYNVKHYPNYGYFDKKKNRINIEHKSRRKGQNSQWWKVYANKKMRRQKGLYNRGEYKKVFDYQWELN